MDGLTFAVLAVRQPDRAVLDCDDDLWHAACYGKYTARAVNPERLDRRYAALRLPTSMDDVPRISARGGCFDSRCTRGGFQWIG